MSLKIILTDLYNELNFPVFKMYVLNILELLDEQDDKIVVDLESSRVQETEIVFVIFEHCRSSTCNLAKDLSKIAPRWARFFTEWKFMTPRQCRKTQFFDSYLKYGMFGTSGDHNDRIYQVMERMIVLREFQARTDDEKKGSVFGYQKALRALRNQNAPLINANFDKIKGVGKKTLLIIDEVNLTGTYSELEDLADLNDVLKSLRQIHGVGKVKARQLYFEQGCENIDCVRSLVEEGTYKFTDAQLLGIEHFEDINMKMNRKTMEKILRRVKNYLQKDGHEALKSQITGSYRRGTTQSKDVDIMISPGSGKTQMSNVALSFKSFLENKKDVKMLAGGPKQIFILISVDKVWRRVDLFFVPKEEYVAALASHTGSRKTNIRLRQKALDKGWVLNEKYLTMGDGERANLETEEDLYALLEEPYQEPEDR